MRRLSASDIVLKALGLLLLTAAVLKAHELLTTPVAGSDLFSWRPFLIFQVEFELAMGIWLLSGVLKPLAWLVTLGCFAMFSFVTLYKGLTGAASCGCFGRVHINPWITLMAIDLPSVIALVVFRSRGILSTLRCSWVLAIRIIRLSWRANRRLAMQSRSHLGVILGRSLAGIMSMRLVATTLIVLIVLTVTTPLLAFSMPAKATAKYEVLEPETWVGKDLPILPYIDIGEQLKTGNWLVILYHYDCDKCISMIDDCLNSAYELEVKGLHIDCRVSLISVPPHGTLSIGDGIGCVLGQLSNIKVWFVSTPSVLLLTEGRVLKALPNRNLDWSEMLLCPAFRCTQSDQHQAYGYGVNKSHSRKELHYESSKECQARSISHNDCGTIDLSCALPGDKLCH